MPTLPFELANALIKADRHWVNKEALSRRILVFWQGLCLYNETPQINFKRGQQSQHL